MGKASLFRMLDVTMSEADQELVDILHAVAPAGPARDLLERFCRTPNAHRTGVQGEMAPSTAASRWHRAGMPKVIEVRRIIVAHRARKLWSGGAASIHQVSVVLGMDDPSFRRLLRPLSKGTLLRWFENGTPAMTRAAWDSAVHTWLPAMARYTVGPTRRTIPLQVSDLKLRERHLERELHRVRAELRAAA